MGEIFGPLAPPPPPLPGPLPLITPPLALHGFYSMLVYTMCVCPIIIFVPFFLPVEKTDDGLESQLQVISKKTSRPF